MVAVGGGGWFVGTHNIGMGILDGVQPPATSYNHNRRDDNDDPAIISFPSPVGIKAGHAMIACLGLGTYGGEGLPYTLSTDPNWTPVHEDPLTGAGGVGLMMNLYTKIADDVDEVQGRTYTFTFDSTSGALPGYAASCVAWPPRYGTTITSGAATHTTNPVPPLPIASPGGDWQVAFVYHRTSSPFIKLPPNPVVTSAGAVLLCENVDMTGSADGARSGNMRIYASQGSDPIVGEFLEKDDTTRTRAGLVVAAVTK